MEPSSFSRRGAYVTQHQYDDLSSAKLDSTALTPSIASDLAQLRKIDTQSTLTVQYTLEHCEKFLRPSGIGVSI